MRAIHQKRNTKSVRYWCRRVEGEAIVVPNSIAVSPIPVLPASGGRRNPNKAVQGRSVDAKLLRSLLGRRELQDDAHIGRLVLFILGIDIAPIVFALGSDGVDDQLAIRHSLEA